MVPVKRNEEKDDVLHKTLSHPQLELLLPLAKSTQTLMANSPECPSVFQPLMFLLSI